MTERLQDHNIVKCLRSILLSASKRRFVDVGPAWFFTDYVDKGDFNRDSPKFREQDQHVIASDKFRSSKRMQNSFMLLIGDMEKQSILRVAKDVAAILSEYQHRYPFNRVLCLQYIGRKTTLDQVYKVLLCACLKWITRYDKDHRTFAAEDLSNRTKLNDAK